MHPCRVPEVYPRAAQGAAPHSPFGPGPDHFATEELLAKSGVARTSLRNGFYAHSLHWLMGPWRETGVIAVPADGPVSWTAREDAAGAAALILASNGAYEGPFTGELQFSGAMGAAALGTVFFAGSTTAGPEPSTTPPNSSSGSPPDGT